MRISLVCVEDALLNIGFRKLAGYVSKTLKYDTDIYYVAEGGNFRSYSQMIFGTWGETPNSDEERLRRIAEPIASDADIVAFSSMTPYAPYTKKIIKHVRQVNPEAYIIWGGIHAILDPEDAIKSADAICTGEGEFAFEEFLQKYENGRDFTDTQNFWFNRHGETIRNSHRPLMSSDEMNDLPLLQYGKNEKIFRRKKGFVPLTPDIYREFNGLGYNTIWTIGCPLHCTFCANTKFIDNHSNYTQVRHPSPNYIMREIDQALEVHPFISSVVFQDDSFMALHPNKLRSFAEAYKENFDIPFTVMGVIPNYVTEEKMEILLDAGMQRIRMGIQNGSKEILDFYKRPAPPEEVREAAEIINSYQKYMIPPAYDIIVDNPVETVETVRDNIELLRELPDPYHLNLLSLRTIPNTELVDQLEERNLTICDIGDNSYADVAPTWANILIYLIATFPLPDRVYQWALSHAKPAHETNSFNPVILVISRLFHFIRRGLYHLKFFEFSIMGQSLGYVLWKLGLRKPWRKLFVPDFQLESTTSPSPAAEAISKNDDGTVPADASQKTTKQTNVESEVAP